MSVNSRATSKLTSRSSAAGLTGLWTAIFLKPLDPTSTWPWSSRASPPRGASGRNAGMLSETVDHSHGLAIQHFGEKRPVAWPNGRRDQRGGTDRHSSPSARSSATTSPTGRLMVALTPGHLRGGAAERRARPLARHRHLPALSAEEVSARRYTHRSISARSAVAGGGILDPARLTDGLREEAERLGVQVYERHRVRAVERRAPACAAATPSRAGCGHDGWYWRPAPTPTTCCPASRWRFIPLYDYILVSEPLTRHQWETIGWKAPAGDYRWPRPSSTTTARPRTGGCCGVPARRPTTRGNRVDPPCDHSPRALRQSEGRAGGGISRRSPISSFPTPGAGPSARPPGSRPSSGGRSAARRATGSASPATDSAAPASPAGSWPIWRSAGRASYWILSLVTRPPFPYPPEPLRTLAVNTVTSALRRVDQGKRPSLLLRVLDRLGLGFSS